MRALAQAAISFLILAAFAGFGRWVFLRPERIIIDGLYTSKDSFAARTARLMVRALGIFAVFGGTWGGVLSLFQTVGFGHAGIGVIGQIMGLTCAIGAVTYVRREAKSIPPHVPGNPYGWWP